MEPPNRKGQQWWRQLGGRQRGTRRVQRRLTPTCVCLTGGANIESEPRLQAGAPGPSGAPDAPPTATPGAPPTGASGAPPTAAPDAPPTATVSAPPTAASRPAGEGFGQGNRTTRANSPARPACAQGCRPPSRQTRRRSTLDEDTRGHPVSCGCRGPVGSCGRVCTCPGEGSQPRGHRADVV